MTFIEGIDLETMLSRDGKAGLPADKVMEWSKQILQVLDYLHTQNPPIVYRDIKPGNIMIHKDGRAMLIDFGIARFVQESSKTKKTAIGTPGYSPVEQCRGQVEPRSDLYALGATMHHLLTGIEPLPFKFVPLSNIVPVYLLRWKI
jgi:serine/threonine-protein kinase